MQRHTLLPCRWGNVAKYKLIKEFSDLIYRDCIFDLQQSAYNKTAVSLKCILCNGSEIEGF